MSKLILAAVAMSTMVTLTVSAPVAHARDRYDEGPRYRNYRVVPQVFDSYGAVRSRRDPSSLDGRRTGQPRTCGSNFFRYDGHGVPVGPYCN
jgi:hypothetical protein